MIYIQVVLKRIHECIPTDKNMQTCFNEEAVNRNLKKNGIKNSFDDSGLLNGSCHVGVYYSVARHEIMSLLFKEMVKMD